MWPETPQPAGKLKNCVDTYPGFSLACQKFKDSCTLHWEMAQISRNNANNTTSEEIYPNTRHEPNVDIC